MRKFNAGKALSLKPGTGKGVEAFGNYVAVFNVKGKFFAVGGTNYYNSNSSTPNIMMSDEGIHWESISNKMHWKKEISGLQTSVARLGYICCANQVYKSGTSGSLVNRIIVVQTAGAHTNFHQ